jgi:hypothetical protein
MRGSPWQRSGLQLEAESGPGRDIAELVLRSGAPRGNATDTRCGGHATVAVLLLSDDENPYS